MLTHCSPPGPDLALVHGRGSASHEHCPCPGCRVAGRQDQLTEALLLLLWLLSSCSATSPLPGTMLCVRCRALSGSRALRQSRVFPTASSSCVVEWYAARVGLGFGGPSRRLRWSVLFLCSGGGREKKRAQAFGKAAVVAASSGSGV